MERLWQDLRYGMRMLVRTPGVTAAALLALALGTGVNTALFSIVNTVLLRPLPFPDSHELLQVWRTELPRLQFGSASYPRYVDWRERNRIFEETGAYGPYGMTMTGREAPERVAAARATASFFRTLAAPPLQGRFFTDENEQPAGEKVAIVGEQYWNRRFGADPSLLGSTLTLNGEPHTVIGIAPAAYTEMWRVDLWVPLAMAVDQSTRGAGFLVVVGRLRDGLTREQARGSLADLATEMRRDYPNDQYGFFTLSLHEVLTRGLTQPLWILLAATGFVLLIACANVANLLLARAVTRQSEMAVRIALGAGRARLTRQLVTETVLLALAGGALGLLLAGGLLRLFALVAPANFPRLGAITLDGSVLAFSLFIATLTGLLAGVLPALHTARTTPNDALREGTSRGATAGRARAASRLLVVCEMALAVILVAAAGLMVRSLQEMLRQDLGLNPRGVLTFTIGLPPAPGRLGENVNPPVVDFMRTFEERLRVLPGVSAVGAISMLPIASTGTNSAVRLPDRVIRPEDSPLAEFRAVTPGYFETVGMSLVAGRAIDAQDRVNTTPVVVISETLARQLWSGEAPSAVIGRRIGIGFDERGDGVPYWREVVGVSRDVRSRRPDEPPGAETYVPHAQFSMASMAFTVRAAGAPEALVPAVRHELAQLDPGLPLAAVRTFDDVIVAATRNSRLYSVLTAVFGLLAAALAILGIYSVMSYTVAQRTRELAIRSALGASREGLLRLVLREGFMLSGIGIIIGIVGAMSASRVIQSLLYGVRATDPFVLSGTAAAVAAVAALGYLIPAFRAARVEPATALRSE
jgi:putative ABC transport system permease protein